MKQNYILALILVLDIGVLLFETSTLSLSYTEAHTYFGYYGVVGYLSHIFSGLFGQNDYMVRLPFILLHTASAFLLYKISRHFLKTYRERNILIVVFLLLPGVMSSALLVNKVGVVIFLAFLFVYLYFTCKNLYLLYGFMVFLAFVDNSFGYLFLAIFFFALQEKNKQLAALSVLLVALNLFLYGTDIGGYPTGHFLDALGIYSAIFSPVVFVYIVYILYRHFLSKEKNILWYIATVPLLFSLLLSLRQRVHIEYYAPFVLLALLLAARQFVSSYRVRLPGFRKRYKLLFNISLFFLVLHFGIIVTNKFLYTLLDTPKRHFAYKNHIAKELAHNLRKNNITCIKTDYKMQLRLEFYGIGECEEYRLEYFQPLDGIDVTVRYSNTPVYLAYVTKINNQ